MTDSICRRSPFFGLALLPASGALMIDNLHSHAALDYDPAEGSAAITATAAVSSIT